MPVPSVPDASYERGRAPPSRQRLSAVLYSPSETASGLDDNGYPGIYEALREAAETMRRGGGVGYDFSVSRAVPLSRVRLPWPRAPCSYINVFDQSCSTVESAGARGARWAYCASTIPMWEFITAKRTPGRWNNFNVSGRVLPTPSCRR